MHPSVGISQKAMSIMDSITYGLFAHLAAESGHLARYNQKQTLTSREVQAAVLVLLPGELAKHAVSEGIKAVTKYVASQGHVLHIDSPPHPADTAYAEAGASVRTLVELDDDADSTDSGDSSAQASHGEDEFRSSSLPARQDTHVAQSRSFRAGLMFPVGRIARHLKEGNYAVHVGAAAPVYLAGVLEYISAEILELAGNATRENKRECVTKLRSSSYSL